MIASTLHRIRSIFLAVSLIAYLGFVPPSASSQAQSETPFPPAGVYSIGAAPMDLNSGDFNGDGWTDLVTTNMVGDSVSVLLGKGDGSFQNATTIYPVGRSPQNTAVGDFNGDGNLDLAVSLNIDQSIGILLGTGTGTFQNVRTISLGSGTEIRYVEYLVSGDFTSDEILDLVIAHNGNGRLSLSLMRGKGDATFQSPALFATLGESIHIFTVGYVNQDNYLDLAMGVPSERSDNLIIVFLGNGKGQFYPMDTYPASRFPEDVAIGDLNGDSYPDLAVVNSGNTTVSVLLGSADEVFHTRADYPVAGGSVSVVIDDLNLDGRADILTSNYSTNNFSLLLGKGNGTFQPMINFESVSNARTAVTGDFNGDHRPDIAVIGLEHVLNGQLGVFLNAPASSKLILTLIIRQAP